MSTAILQPSSALKIARNAAGAFLSIKHLRELYGSFTKSCDTVTLYGHTSAILDACDRISAPSTVVYMALGEIAEGTRATASFSEFLTTTGQRLALSSMLCAKTHHDGMSS